jgi:hypothetical protein
MTCQIFRSVLDLLQTCKHLEVKSLKALLLKCINLVCNLKSRQSTPDVLDKLIGNNACHFKVVVEAA